MENSIPDKNGVHARAHKIQKLSIFIVLLGLILFSVAGFWLNPLFVRTYKEAGVEVPAHVFRFIKYDGFELLTLWAVLGAVVLAKDRVLAQKHSMWINVFLLLVMFVACVYYPKAIDTIHLPVR